MDSGAHTTTIRVADHQDPIQRDSKSLSFVIEDPTPPTSSGANAPTVNWVNRGEIARINNVTYSFRAQYSFSFNNNGKIKSQNRKWDIDYQFGSTTRNQTDEESLTGSINKKWTFFTKGGYNTRPTSVTVNTLEITITDTNGEYKILKHPGGTYS